MIPAHHGAISYSLDASTFQYTPDAGFYGVDSFGYRVTSDYGDDSSIATVTVFVNQTGNSPPTTADISITLQTNVYAVTFNTLTNAADPDGDTNVLFAVSAPNFGTISTNAAGDITYTRNPNLFGDDAFTYTVTDGRGGYGIGNVKILQQDSDGDGMPDQWEMANGLDPATDDSMSDPDNDGLPNFAEFVLRTNPNAPDNPLNFSSVTNETIVNGFAQLPVYGLNPSLQNPPITLYVNGAPAENSTLWQGPDGQWFVNWDTTFLTNGNYQIQLACQINPPTFPDSVTNLLGLQKTIQIYNPITFDRLTSQFTDFLLLNGTLAETNDTYDVYLYDDFGNLLVYATGLSASDGQISLYWDLTDGNGNQISFGNVQAAIQLHSPENPNEIHANDVTDPEPIFHWLLKAGSHIDGNVFAVAWGYNNYLGAFENYRNEMMQDGVVNILGNPADDSPYALLPGANIPFGGSVFRYDDKFDRDVLIDYSNKRNDDFNKSGNFFWFGHGGELGDDFICGNPDKSNITADDVENDLQNKSHRSTPKHPYTNEHPYCLTILNACDTYTPGWSSAFGVDFSANGTPNSAADYAAVGRPSCAFVGWTRKIGIPGGNDVAFEGVLDAQYGDAWGTAFAYWMAGYPLDFCMNEFSLTALDYQPILFTHADSWQISGCHDMEKGDP